MITYTKLRSGDWGVRTESETVSPGQVVSVRKKDGSTKRETIAQIVWSGGGIQLCAIAPKDSDGASAPKSRRSRGTWTGCACGSVEEYEKQTDCFTCRHDR